MSEEWHRLDEIDVGVAAMNTEGAKGCGLHTLVEAVIRAVDNHRAQNNFIPDSMILEVPEDFSGTFESDDGNFRMETKGPLYRYTPNKDES